MEGGMNNYLLTKSEIFMGKCQTETLTHWPSDSQGVRFSVKTKWLRLISCLLRISVILGVLFKICNKLPFVFYMSLHPRMMMLLKLSRLTKFGKATISSCIWLNDTTMPGVHWPFVGEALWDKHQAQSSLGERKSQIGHETGSLVNMSD